MPRSRGRLSRRLALLLLLLLALLAIAAAEEDDDDGVDADADVEDAIVSGSSLIDEVDVPTDDTLSSDTAETRR